MLTPELKEAVRNAFLAGALKVRAVDPSTKVVKEAVISDVMKHDVSAKRMLTVSITGGAFVTATEDHSLFSWPAAQPVKTGDLFPGMQLMVDLGNLAGGLDVLGVLAAPGEDFAYDLCVPGFENFILTNGIVAHNSYSIGGVSLDIDKASKYESLKQNAEGQFDKGTEAKVRTVKFIRGLQQPRFGRGVRSSFGPFVGRGVLSPRAFV